PAARPDCACAPARASAGPPVPAPGGQYPDLLRPGSGVPATPPAPCADPLPDPGPPPAASAAVPGPRPAARSGHADAPAPVGWIPVPRAATARAAPVDAPCPGSAVTVPGRPRADRVPARVAPSAAPAARRRPPCDRALPAVPAVLRPVAPALRCAGRG